MSPVASVSPLWWVVRGMSRLLTSLAVALAFAAAAPGLPGPALFGPAATALSLDASRSVPAATAPAAPGGSSDILRTGDPRVDRATAVTVEPVGTVALAVPVGTTRSRSAATLARATDRVPAAAAGPRAPPAG
ncbi:hypothetical protein [Micromonospora rifamycinica]|uniref:Uncharacterized protein n=1 Tax=Micromonospora rifamycinica TaxID=291594 RepID=A0A109II38_9ACTN|nr:hypothetical protein [Micromonospora rifamycinica]KWV30953.1 hypothetical protein AWV63_20160 [Micromonospora rifamycinica]SCG50387.1 hypothetical protein GA0070623_1807 [Micromonospora rifamycinica]